MDLLQNSRRSRAGDISYSISNSPDIAGPVQRLVPGATRRGDAGRSVLRGDTGAPRAVRVAYQNW
jgi:hypothetical protein